MGILIVDPTYFEDIDATLANTVLTVKHQIGKIYRVGSSYIVVVNGSLYASQTAYQSDLDPTAPQINVKKPVLIKDYQFEVSEQELKGDLFKLIYDRLKVLYPLAVDC